MATTDPSLIVRVGANLDDLRGGLKDASSSVDAFAVATGEFMADAAEKLAQYLVDLAKALPELMLHGSDVADLEENFKRLTDQVGLMSDSLMKTLRDATHGTVDDFTLMKRVNEDLAAGLKLSEGDFDTLAKGAFALANATGVDTVQALDAMNDALVKGKAKGIEALTGVIDLKKAEEDYARTLGLSSADLSEQGKLYADRQAMLHAVADATARLGEQTDGLDEKVAQAKIAWTNFLDELGKTLATSPVLIAAIDGIQQIIAETFSVDKQGLIKAIGYVIDSVTIGVVEMARGTVDAATEIGMAWHAVGVVFNTLYDWILEIERGMLRTQEIALKVRAFIEPWNDWSKAISDVQAHIADVDRTIAANKASIADHEAAEAKWAVQGQELSDKLAHLSARLQEQRDATYKAGTAAEFVGPQLQKMGAAAHDATGDIQGLTAAERAAADMQTTWNSVLLQTAENQKKVGDEFARSVDKTNAAITAELNARKELNAQKNLNIQGEYDWSKTLDASAKATYDYQQKLDALHKTKANGIDQTAQETIIWNEYTTALDQASAAQDSVAASAANIQPPIAAADHAVAAMTNTLVLGVDNIEALNAALSDFYDQFAGSNVGTPGTGSYGTPEFIHGGGYRQATDLSSRALARRADGGPVSGGQPYMVGERGPELFVPGSSGAIVPSGGSVTNNFYITQPLGTPQQIAAAVGSAQMSSMRSRGERFRPSGV